MYTYTQHVVQRSKRGAKKKKNAFSEGNVFREEPRCPQHDEKLVDVCQSLQSKGHSNDHCSTQGSQLPS